MTLKTVDIFLGSFGLSVADESNQRDVESGTEARTYEPVQKGEAAFPFPIPRLTPGHFCLWVTISPLHLLGSCFLSNRASCFSANRV